MTPTERRLLNDFANGHHCFEAADRSDVERLQRLGLVVIKDYALQLQVASDQGGLAFVTADGVDALGGG
jgi:hypothetical protein